MFSFKKRTTIKTEKNLNFCLFTLQKLQRMLEFLEVQEEYIKDEQRNLKKEYLHAQEEVKRIQSVPLVIGQFLEAVDQNTGIVGSTTGSNYYVRILSTIDRELLKPSASVALHKHSNALVDVLPPEADSSISMLQAGSTNFKLSNISNKIKFQFCNFLCSFYLIGSIKIVFRWETRHPVQWHRRYGHAKARNSWSSRVTSDALWVVQANRYWSTKRSFDVRTTWMWQNYACQSSCQTHNW